MPALNPLARPRMKEIRDMTPKAFQDYYRDDGSHCYGCGRLNDHGLKVKSYWRDDGQSVCHFTPQAYHSAMPGYVYGGLIASIIDCHATGTAAAAACRAKNRTMDVDPPLRFVTASLHVDYLKPTPLGITLELRGEVREIKDRKVVVDVVLFAKNTLCVRGQVVAVQLPDHL